MDNNIPELLREARNSQSAAMYALEAGDLEQAIASMERAHHVHLAITKAKLERFQRLIGQQKTLVAC